MSFRTKLFAALMLLTGGVTLVLIALVWRSVRTIPLDVTRAILETKLAQGSRSVGALSADIAALGLTPNPEQEAYRRLHAELVAIAAAGNSTDGLGTTQNHEAFLLVRPFDSSTTATLLVTLKSEEAGRPYDMSKFPGMLAGWDKLTVDREAAADEYGVSLSGYAPVRDGATGRVVALLGIDAPAADIALSQGRLLTITMVGGTAALLGSAVFAFLLARLLHKPVALLTDGITRVSAGDLKTLLPPTTSRDEFSALIPQFNAMVEGLRERHVMKKSLELASQIQHHLLPQHAPKVEGFDLFAGADYCDETGGDYYDFVELPPSSPGGPGRVGMVIADVAGHGIASALVMTSARGVLRSNADRASVDPGALLRAVNTHLYRDVEVQKFVTMFYGVLDPATSQVLWSSAGHEEGLLLRADGTLTVLGTTGVPLTVLEDETFPTEGPVTLGPGDVLIVGTDGIRECRNPAGEFFETERLLEVVRVNKHMAAGAVYRAVLAAVHAFRGTSPQQDDITLLVVKAL